MESHFSWNKSNVLSKADRELHPSRVRHSKTTWQILPNLTFYRLTYLQNILKSKPTSSTTMCAQPVNNCVMNIMYIYTYMNIIKYMCAHKLWYPQHTIIFSERRLHSPAKLPLEFFANLRLSPSLLSTQPPQGKNLWTPMHGVLTSLGCR